MTKRLLAMLLTVIMIFSIIPFSTFAATIGDVSVTYSTFDGTPSMKAPTASLPKDGNSIYIGDTIKVKLNNYSSSDNTFAINSSDTSVINPVSSIKVGDNSTPYVTFECIGAGTTALTFSVNGLSATINVTVICNHTGGTATCLEAAVCDNCKQSYGDKADHVFDETTWESDGTNHWHPCKTNGCTEKSGEVAHTEGTAATCTTKAICATCSQEYGTALDHLPNVNAWVYDETGHWYACTNGCGEKQSFNPHNFNAGTACGCGFTCEHTNKEPVAAKSATCTEAGYTAHESCTACGAAIGKVNIPAGHTDVPEKWETNKIGHWHVCQTCKANLDVANHQMPADYETTDTTHSQTCTVCGYVATADHVWGNDDKCTACELDKPVFYTVTYKDNGWGVFSPDQVHANLRSGTATPTFEGELVLPGYTFKGWYPEVTETVTKTVEYVAQWEQNKYTITYKDGVDGTLFDDQSHETTYGQTIPKCTYAITRPGYVFTGWNPVREEGETVTKSIVYTAVWAKDENDDGQPDDEEDKYTITYTDGVEDEEIFADQEYTRLLAGVAIPDFQATDGSKYPTREGNYIFDGWKPKVEGTVTADTTYTAVWAKDENQNGVKDYKETKRTVTYIDMNNQATFADQAYTDLLPGTATPEFLVDGVAGEPTREGYVFKGWKKYGDNSEFSATVTDEDVMYCAQWAKLQTVQLVIYRNGDTTAAFQTVALPKIAKGDKLDISTIDINEYYTSEHGFEFSGFYNDGGWNGGNTGTALSGEITVNGWTNLHCMVKDIHTVTVREVINGNKENAQIIASGEFLYGDNRDESLNSLTIPEKPGYTLTKWFNWLNGNEFKNAAAVIQGDIEAYVTYDVHKYTIKLRSGTGASKNIEVAYDEDVILENPFNRKGYMFKEWTDGTNVYAEDAVVSKLTEVDGDSIKLTAVWTELCEHGKLEELCGCCDGYHSYDEDYECVFCGEKCSHNKVTVKKVAATCTEPGHKKYQKCTECSWNNDKPNKVIPATGHTGTYVAQGDATCTEDGTAIRTCRTCGDIDEKVIEGSATGHNYAEANCEEPQTCINCGETQAAALGHDFADATCEEPETCIHCGETRGEPEGHDEELVSLNKNRHQLQCINCGEALGKKEKHTKVYFDLGDGTHQQECSECYEVLKSPVKHTYNTRGICKSCNAVKGVSCSHNWEDMIYTPASRNGYHNETCGDCGTNFGSVKCSDYDLDDDCDFCGETISASTNAYRYVSNFLLFWL